MVKGKNASVVRIRLLSMRKRRVFPDPIWVTRMPPTPKKYGHRVYLSRNADKNIYIYIYIVEKFSPILNCASFRLLLN